MTQLISMSEYQPRRSYLAPSQDKKKQRKQALMRPHTSLTGKVQSNAMCPLKSRLFPSMDQLLDGPSHQCSHSHNMGGSVVHVNACIGMEQCILFLVA